LSRTLYQVAHLQVANDKKERTLEHPRQVAHFGACR
jgi:hypothetical protein